MICQPYPLYPFPLDKGKGNYIFEGAEPFKLPSRFLILVILSPLSPSLSRKKGKYEFPDKLFFLIFPRQKGAILE